MAFYIIISLHILCQVFLHIHKAAYFFHYKDQILSMRKCRHHSHRASVLPAKRFLPKPERMLFPKKHKRQVQMPLRTPHHFPAECPLQTECSAAAGGCKPQAPVPPPPITNISGIPSGLSIKTCPVCGSNCRDLTPYNCCT